MKEFMLMEPTNLTFQELFSNGMRYAVPRFQRDYAWGLEQWEDLWSDLSTLHEEHYHYMGYIVLQRKEQYHFEVIDGQQRLVTATLIILAAMKQIQDLIDAEQDPKNNKERLDELRSRFIGSKDIVSLKVSSKLSLNRNNKRFYRSVCSQLAAPNVRGLTVTNKLVKKCFDFFYKQKIGVAGHEIAAFVEQVTSGLMFTRIVVQDNLNAYKVFETLNARGVQLSTPDLLKNYLFSVITGKDDVPDEQLDELDEDWSAIVDQLGENTFTDFTRYHHNFQKRLVTKKGLFKSIRELADTPESSYSYVRSLAEFAPVYASLLSPYDEWWALQDGEYRPARHYLEGLKLFNIKQPFTILMAAFKAFSPDEFIKLLRYIYVLSIRYNVICRHSPNEQERSYNRIAMRVFHKEFTRASHVKNSEEFRALYPEDSSFINAFEFYKMPSRRSSKKIRFLLAEIERFLGHEVDYTKTTLEHVCPYNPDQGWYDHFGQGANEIADRLGNMVLLTKDDLKRSTFAQKKEAYLLTPFRLAHKVAEYEEWSLKNVNLFQEWLACQAALAWRVD
ncbi:hypothetical protein H206_01179 [Candidatus Electrothrix aarhusensis]|jgi:hypothetical protein|uniref:DUF262 domain-containing protein n=1 Tax=Candidatus Electrothrix aarhusensis TaxID=1859131 RepID=A0A444IVV8_9BACT|nr:hypothetical protein H206_01179 [Candidatus Electrothrix aarhusensis]